MNLHTCAHTLRYPHKHKDKINLKNPSNFMGRCDVTLSNKWSFPKAWVRVGKSQLYLLPNTWDISKHILTVLNNFLLPGNLYYGTIWNANKDSNPRVLTIGNFHWVLTMHRTMLDSTGTDSIFILWGSGGNIPLLSLQNHQGGRHIGECNLFRMLRLSSTRIWW